jgi:uncharacterized protein with PIN domain
LQLSEPRFLADCCVGGVAKWLRILGYDTKYLHDANDSELIEIARKENRILLTRDREFLKRKCVMEANPVVLLLKSEDTLDQLVQVISHFDLNTKRGLTRCVVCNGLLSKVTVEQAAPYVPAFVAKTHTEFYTCLNCNKFYWRGSHLERMSKRLEGVGIHLA